MTSAALEPRGEGPGVDGPELDPRAAVPPDGGGLLGRAAETRRIDEVLAAARNGLSAALVLVGEPGIGKTSLLRYAARAAGDLQVLEVVGAEPEQQMGYAGLHRLLVPHLGRLDALPMPQREALGAAFGLVSGPAPDRFLVGLGALTLLAEIARTSPPLCILADARWLAPESLEARGFVARRLPAARIGALVTRREDDDAGTAPLRGIATL